LEEVDPDKWEAVMNVKLNGKFNVTYSGGSLRQACTDESSAYECAKSGQGFFLAFANH
jgi:hypothetical protein